MISKYLKNKERLSSFNHPMWIEILSHAYQTKKVYFIAYSNDTICGVLSGYIVTSLKFRRTLHTLKDGLVADSSVAYLKILDYANEFCKKNKINSFLISTGECELSKSSYDIVVKKSLKIKISKTIDECWDALSKNRRNQVRKVIKQGFCVDKNKKNLRYFYKIYANSMIDKKVPIHSFNFFETMFKQFGNLAELITLKKGNNIVAGIVLIRVGDYVYYPFQASDKFFFKYELNNLLIWEAIKYCVSMSIPYLYMGEATENGGVYKFKIRVGGKPFDSFYYTNIENFSKKLNYSNNEFSFRDSSFKQIKNYIFNLFPLLLLRPLYIFLRKRTKML